MYNRFFNKRGQKRKIILINHKKVSDLPEEIIESQEISVVNKTKSSWFGKLLCWSFNLLIVFLKWLWSYPKKWIKYVLTAIGLWLLSFLPFKLPNLPFIPVPIQQSKPQETKKDDKKEDNNKQESKPVDQFKTNIVTTTVTNVVTQTNMVTQTNYVSETKYITNYVVQPIVVTNTVFKEVPVTVTNVLVIKNQSGSDNNNTNKNRVLNGPAFYFTEDFNTLLQNQQQNPIKGQTVN